MTDPNHDDILSAADHEGDPARALAEAMVDTVVGHIRAEAEKQGGVLTLEQLDRVRWDMDATAEALHAAFERSVAAYVGARSGEFHRRQPFDRLMVGHFEHLFADSAAPAHADDAVSRRMLPAFFLALSMMLGAERMDDYRDRCRRIMDRVHEAGDEAASWDAFYADEEARLMVLDAQVAIASHFEDAERRKAWFLNLVNNNLAPAGGAEGETHWHLTENTLERLLGGLFSDLRAALATEAGRAKVAGRYGDDRVPTLMRVMDSVHGDPPQGGVPITSPAGTRGPP
jgi:hypothetical protein